MTGNNKLLKFQILLHPAKTNRMVCLQQLLGVSNVFSSHRFCFSPVLKFVKKTDRAKINSKSTYDVKGRGLFFKSQTKGTDELMVMTSKSYVFGQKSLILH